MKSFWNERYASPEFIYGKAPNAFFKEQLDSLVPGKLLLPAEGEGRNAAYAASQGWEVTAFDSSDSAKKKAQQLAKELGVSIDYRLAGFGEIAFPPDHFDCIALIFAHLPFGLRSAAYPELITHLKPGGILILEGFSKNQLGRSSGGPQNLEMLFSEAELRGDFGALSELAIEELEVELNEGKYHTGPASVIRLVGRK